MTKKRATTDEREYMGRIAKLPCACCGGSPVEVHHIRSGVGLSQRSSNYLTIPLCTPCHRGSTGIHGDKSMMKVHKISELDMLADTIRIIANQTK